MSLLATRDIDDVLQKQEQVRQALKNSSTLASLSLLELGQQLSLIDSERGTFVETWLQLHGFTKVSSRLKRGDLVRAGEYVEVKARFLSENERKTVVAKGGQVRLWQDISYYLLPIFVTDTIGRVVTTEIYRISKPQLINHYRLAHITASSSSHGAGKLAGHEGDIDYIIHNEIELGLSLNRKKYDWSEYLITEQQLFT